MSPATGWTEQSYYRARDAARRAFDRSNQQLSLGVLEEAGGPLGVRAVVAPVAAASPASSSASCPPSPADALDSVNTNGGAAHVPQDERGIPGKGA